MDSMNRGDNATGPRSHKILFIDAFDSFANNIVGLLEQSLDAEVTLVHIDDSKVNDNLPETLSWFDAVVIGPGPGHPGIPSDVGFISKLWTIDKEHQIPILGICLGFQSLCLAHGATVKKLPFARHGIVTKPNHNNTDIFADIGNGLEATQYHSLHVDLYGDSSEVPADNDMFWEPTDTCPYLHPLAWDATDPSNGPILMAVRHSTKPLWGVQFHPESICTSEEGKQLIVNWWTSAKAWLSETGRTRNKHQERLQETVGQGLPPRLASSIADITPWGSPTSNPTTSHMAGLLRSLIEEDIVLRWGRNSAANINPTSLAEKLGQSRHELVLLDSQNHPSGRFSILGCVVPGKTMKVTYRVSDNTLRYGLNPGSMYTMQLNSVDEVWPMLQEALALHDPRNEELGSSRASSAGSDFVSSGLDQYVVGNNPNDSPFWGGFMGYISYEAGLETIDVTPPVSDETVPDINFAFMHRTIVIDHQTSCVYIQSLLPKDWAWILDVGQTVDGLASRAALASDTAVSEASLAEARESQTLDQVLKGAKVSRPAEARYRSKVLRCQEHLATGDSYELCLTDETKITARGLDEWALYKRLRRKNPAPFGAFMRLSGVTVVGSSPERFLSWSRDGKCQFRPIKGTVKKSDEMTREKAHEILGSSKERAENLMIVDLIRHDLSGVIGANKTSVSKLMVVEEYETVYQLVSVIEGQLPDDGSKRGIDVLKASLPPGSMTGAPKKRSCEILTDIEQRPRGVYSGVLGYMDVGGAGDFSVVIRTAVKSDEQSGVWTIGAGGAVTIQSTDEGEFHEMETKCSSVLSSLLLG